MARPRAGHQRLTPAKSGRTDPDPQSDVLCGPGGQSKAPALIRSRPTACGLPARPAGGADRSSSQTSVLNLPGSEFDCTGNWRIRRGFRVGQPVPGKGQADCLGPTVLCASLCCAYWLSVADVVQRLSALVMRASADAVLVQGMLFRLAEGRTEHTSVTVLDSWTLPSPPQRCASRLRRGARKARKFIWPSIRWATCWLMHNQAVTLAYVDQGYTS